MRNIPYNSLLHKPIPKHEYLEYSAYKGYAFGLRYGGPFEDKTPVIGDFINTKICAIDAVDYRMIGKILQFKEPVLNREIKKAYCGFLNDEKTKPVATGNWGCGAFLGNPQHKSILQYIACSEAERPFTYCTFGNEKFSKDMDSLFQQFREIKMTVGELYRLIVKFDFESTLTPTAFVSYNPQNQNQQRGYYPPPPSHAILFGLRLPPETTCDQLYQEIQSFATTEWNKAVEGSRLASANVILKANICWTHLLLELKFQGDVIPNKEEAEGTVSSCLKEGKEFQAHFQLNEANY